MGDIDLTANTPKQAQTPEQRQRDARARERAQQRAAYLDDTRLGVDEDARVIWADWSRPCSGACWVQAWIWLDAEDADADD